MAFLESLESRLFLSVTPGQVTAAVKVIKTGEALVNADLNNLNKQGHADFAVITGDVKRLKATKADKSIGLAADKAGKALVAGLHKAESAGAALVNRDVAKLDAAEKALAKKPTDATLQGKVSADETALNTDASGVLTKLQAAADTTAVDTDLTAIATANSTDAKTGTDVTTAETDINTKLNIAGPDATTVYTTDITALENLFA